MNALCKRCVPSRHYLLKVNNKNARTMCEICSKLTIKTPERPNWHRSGVFIVNFEHNSHLVLVFLLLTLSRYMPDGWCVYFVRMEIIMDDLKSRFSKTIT